MKNSSSTQDRGFTTEEYLEHLATEEKRSALLSKVETDPKKKQQARRDNRMYKTLIKRVRRITGCRIETAGAWKLDPDSPAHKKTII